MPQEMQISEIDTLKTTHEVSPFEAFYSDNTKYIKSFGWNQEQGYMLLTDNKHDYPVVTIDEDYLPLGDSGLYCLHVDWIPKGKSSRQD